MSVTLKTGYGLLKGNEREHCYEFLGIRYARAGRFEYAVPVHQAKEDVYDATSFGPACPQTRAYYEHLEIPERRFYHHEFREGITYDYDEDCLNLNVYAPKSVKDAPVIIFIHGGGFDSGSVKDSCFDGEAYCKRGVILVTINYRVGVLGYLTHDDIFRKYGRDGNFGLDDQLVAIRWVKQHIRDLGGDPDNITLMGQSAGAISIQYMCLSRDNEGLFRRVIMMSGGGLFPKFALPRPARKTHEYWMNYMEIAGCADLEELKKLDLHSLFTAIDSIKKIRKDNTYNTMPVVDGVLITAPVDTLIGDPLKVGYMIGYTNNDMYAAIMAYIGNKFAAKNNGYVYFFDIDAPGNDNNGAFHSSDLRYMFHTLSKSHRPYDSRDEEISNLMIDYVSAYATCGDPNGYGSDPIGSQFQCGEPHGLPRASLGGSDCRPVWTVTPGRTLCINKKSINMGRPNGAILIWNMLTKGDPK